MTPSRISVYQAHAHAHAAQQNLRDVGTIIGKTAHNLAGGNKLQIVPDRVTRSFQTFSD